MKSPLTKAEYFELQWIKAREALAAERVASTKQESKLLQAVSFMATIAKDAATERANEAQRAAQSMRGEIKNTLLEIGLERKAEGSIEQWGVELGDSPENSTFTSEIEQLEDQD